MSWITCPICSVKSSPGSIRCSSCGADFHDPAVRAMADVEIPDDIGAAGELSSGRFLGFRTETLTSAAGLRKLAIVGGALILAGFLVPLPVGYTKLTMAWSASGELPPLVLWFPLLALVIGAASVVPRVGAGVSAAGLTVAGIGGLVTLPWLSALAAAGGKAVPLFTIGLALFGLALVGRILRPETRAVRIACWATAAVTLVAMFIPVSGAERLLPFEVAIYLRDSIGDASLVAAFTKGFARDPMVMFVTLWALLPVLVVPLGAALAWRRAEGVWDKSSQVLRPIAWLVVLYWPLGFALLCVNLMGWSGKAVIIDGAYLDFNDFMQGALTGRARLIVLSAGFALWAHLGAAALVDRWLAVRNGSSRPAPESSEPA